MSNNYFSSAIEELAAKQEYFPGTGGNISYKPDNLHMVIKSSGRRVSQMNSKDGVTTLSYVSIKDFFYNDSVSEDGEKASYDLIMGLVSKDSQGRPSIETGFHALLGRAVIHSHSAFVNLLACSSSFERIVETIFFGKSVPYVCLPYAKPGYHLTHVLLERVKNMSSGVKVFFMQNHGLIVSADSMEEAVILHEHVNKLVVEYFSFSEGVYPVGVLSHAEGVSTSKTQFLAAFIKENISIFRALEDNIIFPDLTVFCEDILVTSDPAQSTSKITIDAITGDVFYRTSRVEAHCIEENFIAFAFIMSYMKQHRLTPVFISKEDTLLIKSMESEKYRKMLLVK